MTKCAQNVRKTETEFQQKRIDWPHPAKSLHARWVSSQRHANLASLSSLPSRSSGATTGPWECLNAMSHDKHVTLWQCHNEHHWMSMQRSEIKMTKVGWSQTSLSNSGVTVDLISGHPGMHLSQEEQGQVPIFAPKLAGFHHGQKPLGAPEGVYEPIIVNISKH